MIKKILSCLMLCICVCLLPCTSYAVSTADAKTPIVTYADCSLELSYSHDELKFSNLPIRLYCIATISSDLSFALTDAFRETGLTVNGINSTNEWNAVRTTLESYIESNGIAPHQTAATNEIGTVRFEHLTPGMYFAMPVHSSNNGINYYFDSSLVSVPDLNENGAWLYNVAVNPKPDIYVPSEEDREYSVIKLWRDSGDVDKRPASVETDIICNGQTEATVVLSSENNWSYSWKATDNGDMWTVAEKNVPNGYNVTVEEHGTSFVIINTEYESTDSSYRNTDFPHSIPDKPYDTTDSPNTGDTMNIALYIMLMCVSGLALIILGATAKGKTK